MRLSEKDVHQIIPFSLIRLTAVVSLVIVVSGLFAQSETVTDTTSALVKTESIVDSISQDSLDRHTEISPLDIGRDRGLFILSSDKLMQMRILGSVRSLFTLSDRLVPSQRTLNPLEIPTDDSDRITNFYAGLDQTRLGFEVTRRTRQVGDIFLRIEADFAGSSGGFRIRHAYGQLRNLLVGQTWSLFSNVQYLPATVDVNGPSGSISIRTPQIRYFRTLTERISWYAGIEYSTPTIATPDSINAELVQVIPDVTSRLDYVKDNLSLQFVFLLATLSGRDKSIDDAPVKYQVGYGFSLSMRYQPGSIGTFYASGTTGRGISHFIDLFSGKGMIAAFDQGMQQFERLPVHTLYAGYKKSLPANFTLNAAAGVAAISNLDFQLPDEYNYSYNALVNVFWQPVDGARIGIEFNHGRRVNINKDSGKANRISFLLFYDF